jgi:hypothetical protein
MDLYSGFYPAAQQPTFSAATRTVAIFATVTGVLVAQSGNTSGLPCA